MTGTLAWELNKNGILGIAMGTSEAVGYEIKRLQGWLNELVCRIDFNKESNGG